jgi:hypothetical protein
MNKLLLLAMAAALPLQTLSAQEKVPTLYGNLIFMNSFENTYDSRLGVYSFPASNENFALTPLATSVNFNATGNGVMDGKTYNFLMSDSYDGEDYTQLYTYDMETWKLTRKPIDVDNTMCAADFTVDPTTGKTYGLCTSWSGKFELCEMDFTTPDRKSLGVVDSTYCTLAADAKGDLYSISAKGNLVKLSKAGVPTYEGSLGLDKQSLEIYNRVQSATFDPSTGLMYWAAQLWDNKNAKLVSALYSLDVATMTLNKIVDFPENAQIVSLYIPTPKAADNAPGAATGISKEFDGGSLTGKILFTAPTTTYGGGELSGDLTYEVSVDGTVLATGNTTPGAKVSAPVTVAKEGTARFEITVSNDAGKGEPAVWRSYIGLDETSVPTDVKMTVADDKATITWQAPDSTLHKGYFDPNTLKYNVYAYRGTSKQLVAENVEGNQAEYALAADGYAKYQFGVVAVNGSHLSDEAKTADFAYGPAVDVTEDKPYKETFDTESSFDAYTSIDANGDKKVEDYPDYGFSIKSGFWDYAAYEEALEYQPNSLGAADDWVLTPRYNLKKGNTYELSFTAWRLNKRYNEKFQVAYGQGYDPSLYTNVSEVFSPDTLAGTDKVATIYTFNIKPEADGDYMFGFHDFSDAANSYYVYLDNVQLKLAAATGIDELMTETRPSAFDVYSVSGVLLRRHATSLAGLPKGLYIVGGRKILVK